eukprot:4075323-Prymnesium_polylepis.1
MREVVADCAPAGDVRRSAARTRARAPRRVKIRLDPSREVRCRSRQERWRPEDCRPALKLCESTHVARRLGRQSTVTIGADDECGAERQWSRSAVYLG